MAGATDADDDGSTSEGWKVGPFRPPFSVMEPNLGKPYGEKVPKGPLFAGIYASEAELLRGARARQAIGDDHRLWFQVSSTTSNRSRS